MSTTTEDLIDTLVADWNKERPDLDVSAMLVIGRILKLSKILEKRAGTSIKDTALHYTDFDVLATLRRSGKPYQLTPKELMKSVLITSGAMTSLLERLTKLELIYRKTDEKDKRVKRAILTEKGKTLIDEAVKLRFEEATESLKVLSEHERTELSNLLRKISIDIG